LFVTLGLGSVVASTLSAAPWLAIIGRHKYAVFALSGGLLVVNYWLVVVRPRSCAPGEICHVDNPMMRINRRVFWASASLYAAAVLVTFGSLLLIDRF
jgi:hypothetical protein